MITKEAQQLIIHPVRQRIFGALAGRELTTEQIAALLDDIPPATLYRHIDRMLRGGLLIVHGERKQRGRTMRVLALNEDAGLLARDAIDAQSVSANSEAVNAFLSGLMASYASALRDPLVTPGDWRLAGYHAELSPDEEAALSSAIHNLLIEACAQPPAPGRRRRLLAFGALPERSLPPLNQGDDT
jgi:DNA-binding transcriptional ArsR family regulator